MHTLVCNWTISSSCGKLPCKSYDNCPCQPVLENMRTYHNCILYYAPYTLLTTAAGSLKNDSLYSDICPQMMIMGFHDAITSKSWLIGQQHEEHKKKGLLAHHRSSHWKNSTLSKYSCEHKPYTWHRWQRCKSCSQGTCHRVQLATWSAAANPCILVPGCSTSWSRILSSSTDVQTTHHPNHYTAKNFP